MVALAEEASDSEAGPGAPRAGPGASGGVGRPLRTMVEQPSAASRPAFRQSARPRPDLGDQQSSDSGCPRIRSVSQQYLPLRQQSYPCHAIGERQAPEVLERTLAWLRADALQRPESQHQRRTDHSNLASIGCGREFPEHETRFETKPTKLSMNEARWMTHPSGPDPGPAPSPLGPAGDRPGSTPLRGRARAPRRTRR